MRRFLKLWSAFARRFFAIFDACARLSDYVAVPLLCAAMLAPVFFGEWIEAIGAELFR